MKIPEEVYSANNLIIINHWRSMKLHNLNSQSEISEKN
jgi:hypothetical protein